MLVFTEYVDTMNYLRDHLVAAYDAALGCYSGESGQRYDAKSRRWYSMTKDQVAKAIQSGEWVTNGDAILVPDYHGLRQLVEAWDGVPATPAAWLGALHQAQEQARQIVGAARRRAEELEHEALEAQRSAARLRVMRELARYLLCLDAHAGDVNQALYEQMQRPTATASRIAVAFHRLGGTYPTWPADLVTEARAFVAKLSANQRQGRLLGKELDAALDDPRWRAVTSARP